ncbi:MAG: phage tail protein, partial [Thermoplasmata archaeon]
GTMAQYAQQFGPVMARKYDMGTQVATAVQQGAAAFECVRVTDGTDVAASALFNGTASSDCSLIATSLYTGTLANGDQMTLSAGAGTSYNVTVARPGVGGQLYTGITGSGATFWSNVVAAANTGVGQLAGASQYVRLAVGAGANASVSPSSLSLPMTITLGSGTGAVAGVDGVATITAAVLIGQDTLPRKGMYCLRSQGCSIGVLADADDSTQWTTQDAFGLQECIYMMLVAPAGTVIANGSTGAVDLKNTAGLNDYSAKLLHGDWIWWSDQTNNVVRLVSPQGFAAGRYSNLSPEQSGLNKQIYSIIASQTSGVPGTGQGAQYATADLALLAENGIDVICNPQPGGSYWGLRIGHNSSTNAAINGDNYTRLTYYIATSLAAAMGVYVGQVINADLLLNIRSAQLSFLQNMLSQGLLGSVDGSVPFSVICDITNNPQSRTALGYVQSDAAVQYQGINEKFICNVQGGTTVVVTTQVLPNA